MEKLEGVVQFILPLLLSYFAYLYGREKDKAETINLRIEAKEKEINVMDRTVEFYKTKMSEMLDEVEDLKTQILSLRELVETLVVNQCKGEDCSYRQELKKILDAREARKKARILKMENKK